MAEALQQQLEQLIEQVQAHPPVMFVAGVALAILLIVLFNLLSRALGGGAKPKAGEVFLDATKFQPLPLSKVDRLSHNTLRLRFDLPEPDMRVGLPIGQHITFCARGDDGKDVFRPYTPVTDDDTPGSVEFVIKTYPQGKMSQVVAGMRVGDTMAMKGPRGRFAYKRNQWKQIGMLAGGTGITPMYQVACALLKDPRDRTRLSLVYGSLTEDDILLRQELDALAAKHPDRFSVHHVLNTPPGKDWSGGSGFITKEVIAARLPAPGGGVAVLRCGPPAMNDAMGAHLAALGHAEEALFMF